MRKKLKSILHKFGFHVEPDAKIAIDLVCGMELSAERAQYVSTYRDETYYFCSQACKDHFDGDSEKYVGV